MKAFIRETNENDIIIDLKGEIDFASAKSFHQVCMTELAKKNIVFNLKKLHFVGSDGLSSFIDTIKDLRTKSSLQFCGVGSEFRKVFADSEIKDIDMFEDETLAT